MRVQQLLVGRGKGNVQRLAADTRCFDALPQQRVFLHRETMPWRQRQNEVVGIENLHAVKAYTVTACTQRRDAQDANQNQDRARINGGRIRICGDRQW